MKVSSFRSILCITAVAASLCGISVRGQELVVNGGFESGDFTGWTVTDSSGYSLVDSSGSFSSSGTANADLGASPNTGTLSQTLNTVIGQAYTLTLFLANDGDGSGVESFNITFDGVQLASLTPSNFPADPNFGPYTKLTFANLTATSSSTVLQFDYRNDSSFFRVDDVSVVPEPSTAAFAVLGFGLLVVASRVRAKARRA
ncbi:MAG: PEP-CTERM sorting domain-containing protein [Chthoniobacterales bacterium]